MCACTIFSFCVILQRTIEMNMFRLIVRKMRRGKVRNKDIRQSYKID